MNSPVATSDQTASSRSFATYVDGRVPRALRDTAQGKTFEEFVGEYAPTAGPLRLGQWACIGGEGRRGPQARNYQATLAFGDRIGTAQAAASGPVAALTEMLHARGVAVEMTAFHQLRAGEHTATFIRGSDGGNTRWALGWSDDPTESALRAVIACANRLIAG